MIGRSSREHTASPGHVRLSRRARARGGLTARSRKHGFRARRSALIAVVALLLVVPLGACGGPELSYTPSVGVTQVKEDMSALSLSVVADGEGTATLVGTLVNRGSRPDELVQASATSPSTRRAVAATLPGGPVALPVQEPVQLGELSAVRLTSPSFRLGDALDLTLSFSHADDMVLKVLMYPQSGYFDDVTITRAPTTSP
jgi:hypothetical protein